MSGDDVVAEVQGAAMMKRLLLGMMALLLMLSPSLAQAGGASWRATPDGEAVVAAMEAPLPALPAEWQAYTDPYATVYAGPGDAGNALLLSRHISRSLPRVAEEMGLPIGNRVHVYLTPDQQTFFSLQPGEAPTWADGTAYPHRGIIFLRAPRARPPGAAPLEQVLDHELAHILLGRAFGPRPVPRWLQEGVAQLVAREYTPETVDRLGSGIAGGNLLTVDELTSGFPADPLRARLAYAQSADLVAYIYGNYGQEALHTIIDEMAAGATFTAAMRAATGMGVEELDARWRSDLMAADMLWLRPLVSDTTLLAVAGLGFLVMGALAIRKRRRQLAEMADEEEAVEAWYAQLSEGFEQHGRYYVLPDPYAQPEPDSRGTALLDGMEGHASPHGPH